MKIHGTLEGWFYDRALNIMWGFIYGDTKGRFVDGTLIHTSVIKGGRANENFEEGGFIVTMNSTYLLGAPREEWGDPDDE